MANSSHEGQNPTLPPDWELYIADGEPRVFDGRFYVYGSRDCPEGWLTGKWGEAKREDWCSDNYHVIWSDDLTQWHDGGQCLRMDDIPEDIRGSGARLWAPDCFKCPKTGRYVLVFCTNAAYCYVAYSDDPLGPFSDVRRVTLNGEPARAIDPGVLVDDDGTVYIALPGEFIIAMLDPDDYSRILPRSKIALRDIIAKGDPGYYPFEGPSLRKRGNLYYYIYIASRKGEYVPAAMDCLVSENPTDPSAWRYAGRLIETRDFIRAGNVHGSFETFNGRTYLSYHRMAPGFKRFTRVMALDRLTFREDGSPVQAVMTSSGAKGCFRLGETVMAASACAFSGGRVDDRFIKPDARDAGGPWPYASVRLIRGESAVYRYVRLTGKQKTLTIRYRCAVPQRLLADVVTDAGFPRVAADLPEHAEWAEETVPFEPRGFMPQPHAATNVQLEGDAELRFMLGKAEDDSAPFELAWFRVE
jgi:hypothetical protein